jgi:hypothetical protein
LYCIVIRDISVVAVFVIGNINPHFIIIQDLTLYFLLPYSYIVSLISHFAAFEMLNNCKTPRDITRCDGIYGYMCLPGYEMNIEEYLPEYEMNIEEYLPDMR